MPWYGDLDQTRHLVLCRPNWGQNQVRTPEGIIPGSYYILVRFARRQKIVALTNPIRTESGLPFKWADARKPTTVETAYCSDSGIVAYETGLWNPENRLMRTHQQPLSKEQLEALLKKLNLL
jgi:hypothetical protein